MSNDITPARPRARSEHATPSQRPGIRGWVKVVIALAVLLVALVIIDRAAEIVTARKLADRIQSTQHLSARPHVSIGGWPFLTQVAAGHYSSVTISSSEPIGQDDIAVSDAAVHLHGVRVGTSDALHGTVADVPVASGDGTALLTYRELDAIIARYVPSIGSQVTVVGTTPGHARLKGPFGLALNVTARVAHGKLTVTPDAAQLDALPSFVRGPVQQALAHPFTLPPFPFNVHLAGAKLEPDGVHLHATARHSVFPVR